MAGTNALSMLLVEDDEDAREILAMMLAAKFPNMTIQAADNGKTGLECFKVQLPAIVITDVNMPIMNGIHLAQEVKTIDADVKLILLTAFNDKTILESAQEAGIHIDHYLMKPVDYRKLLLAIEQCLAEVAPRACSEAHLAEVL